ncbi:MAG TPA: hypothetical protein VJ743_12890 [Albitalea sp.]|nr:hypothetical protein [Albitalea sp.]
MSEKRFIEQVCSDISAPSHVDIFAVRQFSIEENTRRLRRLIGTTGEMCQRSLDRADWVQQADRTLARLPQGGRAEVFHASGALRVMTGLQTMEALFDKVEPRDKLEMLVTASAAQLRINDWVGQRESLAFEKLWQIKAAAADKNNKPIDPVLCRVVGAFRQSVGKVPVWGGASVAVKLAAGGALDSVSMQLLEPSGDAIESAALIPPDQAARQIYVQLESLMGRSKVPVNELKLQAQPLRLGYIHLGKRKAQRVLAPHYVAAIQIDGEEKQAYQFIVSATQKTFQPLCMAGQQPPAPQLRRAA